MTVEFSAHGTIIHEIGHISLHKTRITKNLRRLLLKMSSFAQGVSTFEGALGLEIGALLRLVLPLGRFLNTPLDAVDANDPNICRAGEVIPEVEGTRPWGPRGKGSPSVGIKGPKTTNTTNTVAEKQSKRRKRAHFCYILGPPGSHPGDGIIGTRRGRSLPVHPGFSSHAHMIDSNDPKI